MNSLKHLIFSNVSRNFVKRSCGGNFVFYPIKRQLYSPTSLKLDSLVDDRSKVQTTDFDAEFTQRMKKISTSDNSDVIFSSDLLKMLRVVSNEEDIAILLNMLRKYAKQSASVQFSSYKFGPQIIRLFHVLKKPKEALLLMEEPEVSNLFSPLSCRIVLFDMLYEHQMYDDIIRIYKLNRTRDRASPIITIYFAACWKANTPEVFSEALETHQFLQEQNHTLPSMAKNYLALLCLAQNNPAAAFDILDNSFRTIPFNIKIRALAKAGRFQDLFSLLDKYIASQISSGRKSVIMSDTVCNVTAEMEKAQLSGDHNTRWNNILEKFEELGVLETKNLDEKIREVMYRQLIYRKTETDRNFISN